MEKIILIKFEVHFFFFRIWYFYIDLLTRDNFPIMCRPYQMKRVYFKTGPKILVRMRNNFTSKFVQELFKKTLHY